MNNFYRSNRSNSPTRSEKSYRLALTPSPPPSHKPDPMVEYFKTIGNDDRSNLESIKNVLDEGTRINLLDVWTEKAACPIKGSKIIAGMEIEIQSTRMIHQLFCPFWFWSALLEENTNDRIDPDKLFKAKSTSWVYLGFKQVGKGSKTYPFYVFKPDNLV